MVVEFDANMCGRQGFSKTCPLLERRFRVPKSSSRLKCNIYQGVAFLHSCRLGLLRRSPKLLSSALLFVQSFFRQDLLESEKELESEGTAPPHFLQIHAFEIIGAFQPRNDALARLPHPPNVTLHEAIVGVRDFPAANDKMPGVDLMRFILEDLKVKAEDTLIVKMDIEGAEVGPPVHLTLDLMILPAL